MNQEIREILLDIRTYLKYQRDMGNYYLPRGEPEKMKGSTKHHSKKEKAKMLQDLRENIGNCTRCKLSGGRTNLVFGEGNPDADLMFVGEGPGFEEDRSGRPFVGRAGQLLTKIIEAMGLKREDVYIGNVIKCRPPNNRNPESDEIETCMPFLEKQIEIIQPKVIVCLGTFAAQTLLNTDEKISKLRGKLFEQDGIQIIPTYHPAFLLRNSNMKRPVWDDMKKVMEVLKLRS